MIFQLDIPIYNTNVLFIINPIKDEMDEFLNNENNKEKLTEEEFTNLYKELDDKRYGGYTTALDKGGYLILIKEGYKDFTIFIHELFHVANLILFDREVEYSRTFEPLAYLLGWMTQQYADYVFSVEGKTALEAIKEEKVDNANKVQDFKAEDWYVSKVDGKIHNFHYSDKIEPKFKVGDWIVDSNSEDIYQIAEIRDNAYCLRSLDAEIMGYFEISDIDDDYHLWSINDAKNGDVLCYKDEISLFAHDIKNCTEQGTTFGGFVYHCCYDGKRFITDSLYSLTEEDKIDIHPATKEQRELLFKKMHGAWYEWNYEKKVLIPM